MFTAPDSHAGLQATAPPVVLVVEDEFPVRQAVAEYLREAGYRVIEAASAADSMQVIAARVHVDLVFADFSLPGSLTGHMLAGWLARQFPEIPVLLTSGYSATLSGFDSGKMRRYIPKPYALPCLQEQIEDMLRPS